MRVRPFLHISALRRLARLDRSLGLSRHELLVGRGRHMHLIG
jgi:hypothetical protein